MKAFKTFTILSIFLFSFMKRDYAKDYVLEFPKAPYVSKNVVNPNAFLKIDQHVQAQIQRGAFPGCQIMGIHKGEVIYYKNFGSLDYTKNHRVNEETIYDLASLSKILATTLAIMKMQELGMIKIDAPAKNYLSFINGSNKEHLTLQSLLLHEGGLKAWIPFYKETIDEDNQPLSEIYKNKADGFYRLPVADNLFMDIRYMNNIWNTIMESPVNRRNYVYSDLNFYFLERIVRMVSKEEMDIFLENHFYKPLGLKYTLFNPWKKGLKLQCAPTEIDKYFRQQKIQGYVHDQGAAMAGGVAGHAGLFSTSKEVAILLQMLLNGGVYNKKRYLQEKTIEQYTSYQSKISRRGLGFDKPEKSKDAGPASDKASKSTFGHLGFTGTVAWADPENELIYIFLSNRTFPSAEKNLLAKEKTRKVIHDYLYESIGK